MIDTHCHLTYEPLLGRVEEVLAGARAAGVDRCITVGTSPADAKLSIGLSRRYDNVFATAGVHPHYAAEWTDRAVITQFMADAAAAGQIVALGEMGLDCHYPDPPMDAQRRVLDWQLELAAGLELPIIIHNREATDDTLAVLRGSGIRPQRFVFHCFTGTRDELDAILAFGAMVSFTGIVTFGSARDLAAASDRVPLERLMVETDSPYLTPEPHRKVRPNEPRYVPHVAEFLARRRGMSTADFTAAVDANAERFFALTVAARPGLRS